MKQIVVNNFSTWYYITEDGKCYNEKTKNWLRGQINKNSGYLSYQIILPNGLKKRIYAHRAVAIAYIANPENKSQVNHIDGNKTNNCVDNLEWATQKENQQHALALELRNLAHIFCFDKNQKLIAEYKDIAEAARAVNCAPSLILQEVNKPIKTLTHSFYWSKEKTLGEIKKYSNARVAKEVYQYSLKGKFIMAYPSTGIAAKAIGGKYSHIGECCRGKIKTYKGYVWRYAEDIVSPSMKIEE